VRRLGRKVDGLIDDPRVCPFDARSLLCAQGQDTAQCLTEQQAKVVNLVYKDLRDPYTGEQIWPGYEPGSESEWAGHLNPPPLQVGFVKYMIFKDPNADASTFNFSDLRDYTAMNKTRELMHPIMDATEGRSARWVDDGRRSRNRSRGDGPGLPPRDYVAKS
jgi:Tannase and feruloyl esterase